MCGAGAGDAEGKGPLAIVQQFEELLGRTGQPQWAYPWLPAGAVRAAACLVCAGVLRPGGRLKEALAFVEHGHECLQAEVHRQHINVEVRCFSSLAPPIHR